MDKSAVRHSVTHYTVKKGVAVFYETAVRERVDIKTAQRHRHPIGTLYILSSPTFVVARVELQT